MATQEQSNKDERSWQEIATELSQETDSAKITNLSSELSKALAEKLGSKRNSR